jgi:uncharacterized membrane protein YagU involved in acid resistance
MRRNRRLSLRPEGEHLAMSNLDGTRRLDPGAIPARPTARDHLDSDRSRALPAIFWAGLACGLLDITAAFVNWGLQGVSPVRLLQAIASGLLGPRSFRGGWPTALLGITCHFFIAFSASTVFYLASRRWKFMTRNAIPSGIGYGVAVYLVMYWIVMPLSRLLPTPFSAPRALLAVATHIVCVGLPIALLVRRHSP